MSDAAVRAQFEAEWGVTLRAEPGLRIPNMFEAALDGSFKALYVQGEDIAQSDPNTQHVTAALSSLECLIVQDLFLNETAKFAHVFLPGLLVPREGRHLHQRRAAHLARAQGDATRSPGSPTGRPRQARECAGLPDALHPPVRDHGRDRAPDADLHRRHLRASSTGSAASSGRATTQAPDGTPTMHVGEFVRGKGSFYVTEYVPTEERNSGASRCS